MPQGVLPPVAYSGIGSNPMTTQDDLIVGGASGVAARLGKGADGQVLTVDPSTHHLVWATPVAGTNPNHAYYATLAAWMEPDCIEVPLGGTFSYTVGAGVTKYLMLAWACYLAGDVNARYDVRMPTRFLPLTNTTIQGSGSTSDAAILNPALASYTDAYTTYFDRLAAIAAADTKVVSNAGSSSSNTTTFLPGPYGVIITSVLIFDYAWPALLNNSVGSTSWAFEYETSDSTTLPARFQHVMTLPMTKALTAQFQTGYPANGNARGSMTYVILPSTWSTVTDPLAPYTFRDDFMGATLDTTTKWTRVQSTSGNIEINTNFAWCKMVGDGSWGDNGAYSQASVARANGRVFLADVNVSSNGSGSTLIVGFSDGGGQSYTNFAHGLLFSGSSPRILTVYENGTSRGTVGSGSSQGYTYRIRITLGASNNATYEIQGGPEYHPIGGSTWDNITPATSSSSTTPLHAGFTIQTSQTSPACHIGDVRVY